MADIAAALSALAPGAAFSVRGSRIVWRDEAIAQPSDAAIAAQMATLRAGLPLEQLRREVEEKIRQSDRAADEDFADAREKHVWLKYRKALRSLPATTQNPGIDSDGTLTGVTWPDLATMVANDGDDEEAMANAAFKEGDDLTTRLLVWLWAHVAFLEGRVAVRNKTEAEQRAMMLKAFASRRGE